MTFGEALRVIVNVGYIVLQGQDEEKKRQFDQRAYALNAQIISDFGVAFPGNAAELSPAAHALLDDVVNLLKP